MNDYELMGALNNLFDVNDRLGVELMGAGKWNGLKKSVTNISAAALKQVPTKISGFNRTTSAIEKAVQTMKNKSNIIDTSGYNSLTLNGENNALCQELFGYNYEYAAELLGRNWAGRLWDGVKETTHQVLNIGAKIPGASNVVEAIRDTADTIKGTKKATEVATIAYDNRGKIILIGGGAAILLYLLLRKKGRR